MNPKKSFVNNLSLSPASTAWQNYGATKTVNNPSGVPMTKKTPTPVTPSDTSATGTTGTKIKSPAGQTFVNNLAQNTPTTPTPPSTFGTPTPTTPTKSADSEYIKYLKTMFNPEDVKIRQQAYESSQQRLADIQAQQDKAQLEARKGYESILDTSGGLRGGTRAGASQFNRRATDSLADIALQETAAARSAEVAQNAYELAVGAGKSVFDVEQDAEKAREGFNLSEGQVRYEFDPATGGYRQVAGAMGGSGVTSSPEIDAYAQMVNSGQLNLENVPQNMRGSVAQRMATMTDPVTEAKQKNLRDQANVALTSIDTALGFLTGESGGTINTAGSPASRAITGWIPGSDTRSLNNALAPVKALIGFDALQKMRDSSPTGGALGSITERELAFLQSVQGSLDTLQDNEQLVSTLARIKQSFENLSMINSPAGRPVPENPTQGTVWKAPDNSVHEFIDGGWTEVSSFNSVGNTTVSIPQSSRLAFVNNNPGNLRFAGQEGATQGEGGFARFNSPEEGLMALQRQIELDASRGLTLAQFINKYAPPTENDTNKYIQDVIAMTGASPLTPLYQIDLNTITKAIAKKESSTNIA